MMMMRSYDGLVKVQPQLHSDYFISDLDTVYDDNHDDDFGDDDDDLDTFVEDTDNDK